MNQVLADASLPNVSTLLSPLPVNFYHDTASLLKQINTHDILICRSTLKVNSLLLKNSTIKIVGTASSGSEHIDKEFCKEQGISWFNARGANAHAVADYICMIIASLKKNNCTIGKVAGIIGYGAVGTAVKQRLDSLGFIVKCCDPWLIETADFHHTKLEDLKDCDLLLLHCNYHQIAPYPSHHLINKDFLNIFNPKGIIINAARGSIVDETALLNSVHCLNYCSDVFKNEPNINPKIIKKSMIVTPHIAGHSCEAKYNAVVIIAEKILQHINTKPTRQLQQKTYTSDLISPRDARWENKVLSIYNPVIDSAQLKKSTHISQTFLTLRKAHNKRQQLYWDDKGY